uniref:Uncharacterized protein n=1 Tax=Oryza meridionalis TaxID=40149 RepID=A0A0E0DAG4_9ORYZ
MGDKKLTKLKVRGANDVEVKSVLRHEFKESVDQDNFKVKVDGSSLKVDVPGTVDVGKLYERLKKMSSSVKIESVVPDDLMAKMDRDKKYLQNMKKQKEAAESKQIKQEEGYKLLQQEQRKWKRDKENLNSKLEKKTKETKDAKEELKITKREKEYLNTKLETNREENKRLDEENKKLQRKIKDLQEMQKGWITTTSTKLDSFESVDHNHHGMHHRVHKEVHRHEFHMHQEVRHHGNVMALENDGRRAH